MTAALLALLLTGCGKAAEPGPGAARTPAAAERTLTERCLSMIPAGADPREAHLTGPPGVDLTAGVFAAPGADTVLVLLHQIGPAGLCGWGRFADGATDAGVSSIALDLCGYGESVCPETAMSEVAMQVGLATSYARDELGARRVVVVGASMGGSQAVRAVATGAEVDGWVDVSGPSFWDGTRLLDVAERLDVPGLVVQARSDGAGEYRKARALATRSGARFLDGGAGHGWDLVTRLDGRLSPLGRRVLAFTTSVPAAS